MQQQTLWINPQDAQSAALRMATWCAFITHAGFAKSGGSDAAYYSRRCRDAGRRPWQPDENGIDKGGCANVLSSARITALAKGNSHQTMLVEVAKA